MRDDELRAGRALNEACSRALGWRELTPPRGMVLGVLPSFSTDYAAAHLLEDEIERRAIGDKYISALLIEIDPNTAAWDIIDGSDEGGGWVDRALLFRLLRATPEQRARAFLKVVGDA